MAWKTREAAVQAGVSKEASVQFEELTSLLQSRSAEFGGELMRDGQIEEFSELYKEMDPCGKENMEFVVDRLRALEFKKKQVKVVSKTKIQWMFEKVWFKLYEAKKPKWPWGNPDYYEVGETFKHEQTPSGQKVIVDAEVKPAA